MQRQGPLRFQRPYIRINKRVTFTVKERKKFDSILIKNSRVAVSRFLFVFGDKQWNESKSHAGFVVHSEE
jgi:hypothetical protein